MVVPAAQVCGGAELPCLAGDPLVERSLIDEPVTPTRTDAAAGSVRDRRVSSRSWVLVLLLGVLAVCLYYSPLPGPAGRAAVYVLAEVAAIAIVFARLAVNRLARPRAWIVFGAGIPFLTHNTY